MLGGRALISDINPAYYPSSASDCVHPVCSSKYAYHSSHSSFPPPSAAAALGNTCVDRRAEGGGSGPMRRQGTRVPELRIPVAVHEGRVNLLCLYWVVAFFPTRGI